MLFDLHIASKYTNDTNVLAKIRLWLTLLDLSFVCVIENDFFLKKKNTINCYFHFWSLEFKVWLKQAAMFIITVATR